MRLVRGVLAVAYPFLIFAVLHRFSPSSVSGGEWSDPKLLLLVPVAVNLALLFVFARTLWRGTPLVETLARLQEPSLSPAQQRHCRSVTAIWSGFFAANTVVCLGLALFAELWLWTLYTGFVAYVLMAALYGCEYLVRIWRFHEARPAFAEPVLRRLFPEGPST